ncbi:Phosphatidylserine decarboxylase proenzyme [invertebrate metagenome]|uniref:phosphatidylserine decarboxylase n=1 Tax=invertebrate metagenome TaxID=1711999 RepID=A0A2H9T7C5_9ZZZZ
MAGIWSYGTLNCQSNYHKYLYPVNEKLFSAIQYIIPQHLLSRGIGCIAESRIPWLKSALIRWFIKRYQVDMSEAKEPAIESYKNFNAFFIRALKDDVRPLPASTSPSSHKTAIVSPADGQISQIGDIKNGRIFQAKGQGYSLIELLGGDVTLSNEFAEGRFATVYLSPSNYHRVHIPFTGTLRQMIHVPGRLFSVNNSTANHVPRLFARNERVVTIFDTENGPMAVIMVGAMIVASIETPWAGLVTPKRREITRTLYDGNTPKPITFSTGDEIGRFKLGSTAIVLFGRDHMTWENQWQAGHTVRMGEALGFFND